MYVHISFDHRRNHVSARAIRCVMCQYTRVNTYSNYICIQLERAPLNLTERPAKIPLDPSTIPALKRRHILGIPMYPQSFESIEANPGSPWHTSLPAINDVAIINGHILLSRRRISTGEFTDITVATRGSLLERRLKGHRYRFQLTIPSFARIYALPKRSMSNRLIKSSLRRSLFSLSLSLSFAACLSRFYYRRQWIKEESMVDIFFFLRRSLAILSRTFNWIV